MTIAELEMSLQECRLQKKKLVADLTDCETKLIGIKLELEKEKTKLGKSRELEEDEYRVSFDGDDD